MGEALERFKSLQRQNADSANRDNSPQNDLSGPIGPIVAGGESAGAVSPVFENDPAERRAILELDGKVPVEWAEGFVKLMAMPRPRGVTYERWIQVINDAGLLLDDWGARLVELQWDTASVFSVPTNPSVGRPDQSGLAWLLRGCRVVAMTQDHVGVQIRPGIIQRVYRRPDPIGGLILWELRE